MCHLTNHTMTILTYYYWLVITNTIFQIVYGQQSPFRNIQLKPMSHCHHPLWKGVKGTLSNISHHHVFWDIIYKDFTFSTILLQVKQHNQDQEVTWGQWINNPPWMKVMCILYNQRRSQLDNWGGGGVHIHLV